jgi:hypothetical protein
MRKFPSLLLKHKSQPEPALELFSFTLQRKNQLFLHRSNDYAPTFAKAMFLQPDSTKTDLWHAHGFIETFTIPALNFDTPFIAPRPNCFLHFFGFRHMTYFKAWQCLELSDKT